MSDEPVAWRYRKIESYPRHWKLVKHLPWYSKDVWEYQPLYTRPEETQPSSNANGPDDMELRAVEALWRIANEDPDGYFGTIALKALFRAAQPGEPK